MCLQLAKLLSCVEAMQDVVGDQYSESVLMAAARKFDYDHEKALSLVLEVPAVDNVLNVKGSTSSSRTSEPSKAALPFKGKNIECSKIEEPFTNRSPFTSSS